MNTRSKKTNWEYDSQGRIRRRQRKQSLFSKLKIIINYELDRHSDGIWKTFTMSMAVAVIVVGSFALYKMFEHSKTRGFLIYDEKPLVALFNDDTKYTFDLELGQYNNQTRQRLGLESKTFKQISGIEALNAEHLCTDGFVIAHRLDKNPKYSTYYRKLNTEIFCKIKGAKDVIAVKTSAHFHSAPDVRSYYISSGGFKTEDGEFIPSDGKLAVAMTKMPSYGQNGHKVNPILTDLTAGQFAKLVNSSIKQVDQKLSFVIASEEVRKKELVEKSEAKSAIVDSWN